MYAGAKQIRSQKTDAFDDSAFYKKWEKKPHRKTNNPKGRPKGTSTLKDGTPARDPSLLRRFKDAWLRGTTKKIIALNLGISTTLQNKLVHELGLPIRQAKGGYRTPTHDMVVRIPNELWARINRRCHISGMTKARYVKYLIERDLELHQQ